VDTRLATPGGLTSPAEVHTPRQITLFQRSAGKPGSRLGATTGWIHRSNLKRHGVAAISGCTYTRIDDQGLHYQIEGADKVAEVDTIVICAGQEPARGLADQLTARGIPTTLIGGARVASELDAMRAMDEGMRLAYEF
jgi:2,4-dienoyl-CoA reductase (NADPH2)